MSDIDAKKTLPARDEPSRNQKNYDFEVGHSNNQETNTVPGMHSVFGMSHLDDPTLDGRHDDLAGGDTKDWESPSKLNYRIQEQRYMSKNPSRVFEEEKMMMMGDNSKKTLMLPEKMRNSISASNLTVKQHHDSRGLFNHSGLVKYVAKLHEECPEKIAETSQRRERGDPVFEEVPCSQTAGSLQPSLIDPPSAIDPPDLKDEQVAQSQFERTLEAKKEMGQDDEEIYHTETPTLPMGKATDILQETTCDDVPNQVPEPEIMTDEEDYKDTPNFPKFSTKFQTNRVAPADGKKRESLDIPYSKQLNVSFAPSKSGVAIVPEPADTVAILPRVNSRVGKHELARIDTLQLTEAAREELLRMNSKDQEFSKQPMLPILPAIDSKDEPPCSTEFRLEDLQEVPAHHLPLFGDCFSSAKECARVIQLNGKDYVPKRSINKIQFLDLREQDQIYGSSFAMMIKEAFRQNKHFILARIESRASDRFDQDSEEMARRFKDNEEAEAILSKQGEAISNFFNVHSVIKIIFKKKGDQYVGRFHPDLNIAAVNPLTNNRIVGEVEFYFVENPYLKIENEAERYPTNSSLSLAGIKACFIGTDYNFQFSQQLRQKVFESCLEENRSQMLFKEYHNIDYRVQQLLQNNGVEDEQGRRIIEMNEVDNHIHEIVYHSFQDSKIYMNQGFILGIYRILALVTFVLGMQGALQDNTRPQNYDPLLAMNVACVLLPIASIAFDEVSLFMIKRREVPFLKILKILIMLGYWGLMLATYFNYYQDPVIRDQVAQLDEYKAEWQLKQEVLENSKSISSAGGLSGLPPLNETVTPLNSTAAESTEEDSGILMMKDVLVPTLKKHFLVFHLILIAYPIGVTFYSKILQDTKMASLPSEVQAVRIAPNEDLGITNRRMMGTDQDQSAFEASDVEEQLEGSQNQIQEFEMPQLPDLVEAPEDIENSYQMPGAMTQQVAGPFIPGMSEINDAEAEQGSNPSPLQHRAGHFPSAQIPALNQSQDYPVSDALNSYRGGGGFQGNIRIQVRAPTQAPSPQRSTHQTQQTQQNEDPYISNLRDVVTSPAVVPSASNFSQVASMRDFQEIRTLQEMVERVPSQTDLQRLRRIANFSSGLPRGRTSTEFANDPILSNNPREMRLADFAAEPNYLSNTEVVLERPALEG